jgi:hypothetical protein
MGVVGVSFLGTSKRKGRRRRLVLSIGRAPEEDEEESNGVRLRGRYKSKQRIIPDGRRRKRKKMKKREKKREPGK